MLLLISTVVFFSLVLTACVSNSENLAKEENIVDLLDTVKAVEYDKLQQFYLDLNHDITYDEIIKKIKGEGLYFEENSNYDGKSLKIALDKEVTAFTHAKEGDNLKISFDKDLKFEYASYFNHNFFITLLDYVSGTYYDFRNSTDYAGFYINTYNDKAGSFTLKYSNGNETKVEYLKVNSKEDQFKYMKLYGEKKTRE